jgi:hypothetical protein
MSTPTNEQIAAMTLPSSVVHRHQERLQQPRSLRH